MLKLYSLSKRASVSLYLCSQGRISYLMCSSNVAFSNISWRPRAPLYYTRLGQSKSYNFELFFFSDSGEQLASSPTNLGKQSYLPEGNTPGKTKTKLGKQEKKKGPRKSLFPEDTNVERKECNPNSIAYGNWTNSEIKALVQHICLFWDSAHLDKWPTIKNMKFWNECASSVNQMCKSSRTGKCFNFLGKYKA